MAAFWPRYEIVFLVPRRDVVAVLLSAPRDLLLSGCTGRNALRGVRFFADPSLLGILIFLPTLPCLEFFFLPTVSSICWKLEDLLRQPYVDQTPVFLYKFVRCTLLKVDDTTWYGRAH